MKTVSVISDNFSLEEELIYSLLLDEKFLDRDLAKDLTVFSPGWLLIGHQVEYGENKYIDLLALDINGTPIVINFKSNKNYDVVVDTIAAASWTTKLTGSELTAIYYKFVQNHQGKHQNLPDAFSHKFGIPFSVNDCRENQLMVIVADEVDAVTEQAISYMNEQGGLAMNVFFLSAFHEDDQLCTSYGWMMEVDQNSYPLKTHHKLVSEGEFIVSFMDASAWENSRLNGYVSGGKEQYPSMLSEGDRIWANITGTGYVGVGIVSGRRTRSNLAIPNHNNEFLIPVRWLHSVTAAQAFNDNDLYSCSYPVCQPQSPNWLRTLDLLKDAWKVT